MADTILNVRLSEKEKRDLQKLADKVDRTMSSMVRVLIKQQIERVKQDGK